MTNSMFNFVLNMCSNDLKLEYSRGVIGMRIKTWGFARVFFNRFRSNENGATAMEYGLLVALLAIALMLGLNQFYTSLDNTFKRVDDVVTTVNTDASSE